MIRRHGWAARAAGTAAVLALAGRRPSRTAGQAAGLNKVNHIIVIYHAFDF